MSGELPTNISIVESYESFAPSFDVAKLVRQMLTQVPPNFLVGLRRVVLTNRSALPRNDRKRKTVWLGKRVVLGESLGYYSEEWKGEPARITLLVDNIEMHSSGPWVLKRFLRVSMFSDVFYHELGHHIHRVHRPVHEEREDVANRWSKSSRANLSRVGIGTCCR